MQRNRKIIIAAAAVLFLILLIVLCVFSAIGYNKKIEATGLNNTIPYGFGKDAKVIILAGQSNAAGCSRDDCLRKNISEEQYEIYDKGYDNVYINYFISGNTESHAFVKCAARQGEGYQNNFFGPELGMAEKLNELCPDETFFIIKWAWGASNLYDQWRSPGSEGDLGGDYYQSFVKYVNASLEFLKVKNYNVKVEAMCWMQGEADSTVEQGTLDYENNLTDFIADIRTEFGEYASDNGIAFVDAYIADSPLWTNYKEINRAKQAVADSSQINTAIDTIAHGLSISEEPAEEPDLAHYDSLSEIKLGHLFAEQASKFFD